MACAATFTSLFILLASPFAHAQVVATATVSAVTVTGGESSPPDADASGPAPFIKGDLMYVGTRELVSRFDHAGVRVGPRIIGKEIFLGVTPGFAWYPKPWAFALHVPLNLLLLEAGTNDFGGMRVRREDWDEASDIARVIRFITYGRHEDPVYFTITSLRPYNLGHGQLIHFYQPSIDVDRSMTGAVLELDARWAGLQIQANDITFKNRVVGALGFVRPLFFMDSTILSTLSLGVEYAADFRAPRCIQVSEEDRRCVPGSGNSAGFDPLTGQSRDDTFVRTDTDLGRPVVEETTVQAIGFSGEVKVVKTETSDLKLYGTWHKFIDGGDGLAGGALGRFNVGDESVHAFRTRAELRTFSQRFQPSYFDTLYEVTKYQAIVSPDTPYQIAPTRYQKVFGDPENGFVLADTGRNFGYNAEFSWAWFGEGRAKRVAVGLGLQESTRDDDTNFYAHIEAPVLEFLQVFGSFLRLNAPDIPGIFSGTADNIVLLAGARLQILPFMFVNASYVRGFQIVRGAGRELHLGNDNVVDELGQVSPFFASDRIYENISTLYLELELGWEFRD